MKNKKGFNWWFYVELKFYQQILILFGIALLILIIMLLLVQAQ